MAPAAYKGRRGGVPSGTMESFEADMARALALSAAEERQRRAEKNALEAAVKNSVYNYTNEDELLAQVLAESRATAAAEAEERAAVAKALAESRAAPTIVPGGGVGLRNLGNTCYFNASMQALAFSKPIQALMLISEQLEATRRSPECRAFVKELFQLLNGLVTETGGTMSAAACRAGFWSLLRSRRGAALRLAEYRENRENDAPEFIGVVIEEVEECTGGGGGVPEPLTDADIAAFGVRGPGLASLAAWMKRDMGRMNLLSRLFAFYSLGSVEYSRKADGTEKPSVYRPDRQLVLPLVFPPGVTVLREAISDYFGDTEYLDENGMPQKNGNAVRKTLRFWKLPPVLMVQIARLDYGAGARPIEFDPDVLLDLGQFLHPASPERRSNRTPTYRLQAAVVRIGASTESGHLTAWARRGGRWAYYNDSSVTQYGGQAPDRLTRDHARSVQLLVYVQEDDWD